MGLTQNNLQARRNMNVLTKNKVLKFAMFHGAKTRRPSLNCQQQQFPRTHRQCSQ